jgi:predicted CoA-substrate-specific enzyme activase
MDAFVGGIDIGSRTAKAVIMGDGEILGYSICKAKPKIVETALTTINEALQGTGQRLEDIEYIVATGYGRVVVPFANETVSEISCHIKGALYYFPSVRTILDIGGQDSKAIRCNEKGQIVNFIMNDKCAGGTGRFLETVANAWGIPIGEMGALALHSDKPARFTSTCVIFARSEAYSLVSTGVSKEDIIAGIIDSIASRNFENLLRVGIEKDITLTGGVAKNVAMLDRIKQRIGFEPLLMPEPLISGALGAAVIAHQRLLARSRN